MPRGRHATQGRSRRTRDDAARTSWLSSPAACARKLSVANGSPELLRTVAGPDIRPSRPSRSASASRRGSPGGTRSAGAPVRNLGHSADGAGDKRRAAGGCLQEHVGHALGVAGERDHIGRSVPVGQFAVRPRSVEDDTIGRVRAGRLASAASLAMVRRPPSDTGSARRSRSNSEQASSSTSTPLTGTRLPTKSTIGVAWSSPSAARDCWRSPGTNASVSMPLYTTRSRLASTPSSIIRSARCWLTATTQSARDRVSNVRRTRPG